MRPGPGVDKNAPKKKGFFLYFEIFTRKFTKLLGINLLYFLVSLPWIILLYIFTPVGLITGLAQQNVSGEGFDLLMIALRLAFSMTIFLLWGSGPASASFAYISKCYTHEEHAWIKSDGWDKFKENFKQGMIVVLIDAVIILLAMNALMFYFATYRQTGQLLWLVTGYFAIVLLVLYTMMHFYIYQLMVTFECSVLMLYRNSLLLTLGRLPYNVLMLAFAMAIIVLAYLILSPYLSIMLTLVIVVSFVRFPVEFLAARTIDSDIIKAKKKKLPDKEYL